MDFELFLSGRETEQFCSEIFRRKIPQCAVNSMRRAAGECILLSWRKTGECWCISCGNQESALKFAQSQQLRTLTCGFSIYDTLVLSGRENDEAVVSLQREIHTPLNQLMEPGDYCIRCAEALPDSALLLCAGVFLLLGGWEQKLLL